MLDEMKEFLPGERITRVRNMALVTAGLFLAESVHLSAIAKKVPLSGRLASLANRLRRFLKNPRVEVGRFYRPIAQALLGSFEPWQEVRLLLDTTKVGFDHRVLTVSLAYRKRALPLCWSVHSGRKGHLPVKKQIRLLRRVKSLLEEIVPEECAVWVMGDSEFGRVEMFRWLNDQARLAPDGRPEGPARQELLPDRTRLRRALPRGSAMGPLEAVFPKVISSQSIG